MMSQYELKSVNMPKLKGIGLRAFSRILETQPARKVLSAKLLTDVGVTAFRQKKYYEPPTFVPLVADSSHKGASQTQAETFEFEKFQTLFKGDHSTPFVKIMDYAKAYRLGTKTPFEVAKDFCRAFEKTHRGKKSLAAFISCDEADILQQAELATKRIENKQALSLFDGVPIAVKDELNQIPYPTTVGTNFVGKMTCHQDATVVERLRNLGGLMIGKTNMHEIGINPNGSNIHYGTARNPYHLDHDSGGSSSGSAVAVSAGFCPIAFGADGGGSIRIPAAYCGHVGLKATFARISAFGSVPLCWSVAHVGPMGGCVEDVALAYLASAGADSAYAYSQQQAKPKVSWERWSAKDLTGLTFGIYEPWFAHATQEVVQANERMVETFIKAGAQIKKISIPELEQIRVAHIITIVSEMLAAMSYHQDEFHQFSPAVKINLSLGRSFSNQDYLLAQRCRTRALRSFHDIFQEVDAILSPATAITAPMIPNHTLGYGWSDLSTELETMRFAFPANFVGIPAISFPVGYGKKNLPIGMQVMGPHWSEDLLLRVAYFAEQHIERKKPKVHFDFLS